MTTENAKKIKVLWKLAQNTNSKEHKHPMFSAALFTMAKVWKQPKCPLTDEWLKKLWDISIMEYYSPEKKKKRKLYPLQQYGWMWRSEISQSENDFTHMWNLKNKMN